jgi:hypothetical protein
MKWIGQHIYDLVSRFRDDVYLEDISTGTIASGGNLGLDSNNKIVKATGASGDLTSIVAGTGLSGSSLTGPIPTLNVDASIPEITTLAGLTSFGAAGATTNIVAGDLTMYNAVNDGNPTISLGKDVNDRFAIETVYNSGTQTIDYVNFQTYTTSSTNHDGRYFFLVDEVEIAKIIDGGLFVTGNIGSIDADASLMATDTTASSATQGGALRLRADDGAAMADNHRLGVIQFEGAEDGAATKSIGARIQAICRDAWDGSNNDADLEFYTTDGTTESKVLTLDADKLATFTGALTVNNATTSSATEGAKLKLICDDGAAMGDDHRLGKLAFWGAEDGSSTLREGAYIQAMADAAWSDTENGTRLEFYTKDGDNVSELSLTLDSDLLATFAGAVTVTGALTGTLATASQPNITTVGTIGTGVWQGTVIDGEYIAGDAIDGSRLADDAVNSEHYVDGSIDTAHIGDDQVTFAKASGVTPNVFGNIIKLLPSDFAANIDGGNTKLGVGYTDTAGSAYGMKVGSANTELFAFVSIPEGMTATHVDVFDKDDRALEVFEVQINATTMTSKGSGNCNTTLDITDVDATATNFLAIKITTTATTDKVFGGQVTIAAQ